MPTIVNFNNVIKDIKGSRIINNISFEVTSGKIIGLMGANGSGKTMLMRLISGLVLPTSGIIKINNKILGIDIEFPESIGILIENPTFLDQYSGIQNLVILASIKGKIDDIIIKDTIRTVGLNPEDKKKYKKFSLGMKQRLGIAAAIMESPDIVILDEPLNGLDSDGVDMLIGVLQREKERGALIFLSCHDFDFLKKMSDELYQIENGCLGTFN